MAAPEPEGVPAGDALPFHVLEIAAPATAVCGRLLAEAGADVWKIEPPGGAPERGWLPQIGPPGASQSAFSLYHDTGKRGIILDLDAPADRDRLRALAAEADVLLEGLPPGTLAAHGLDYTALRARNPGLVLVSITPFGQDGPYSGYQANDAVVFALGGLMFISGEPGAPPVLAPMQQAHVVAGQHAALAALAVLWGRQASGEGDWIEVSEHECLAAQENTLTNYRGPGQFTRRNGSQHRSGLPGQVLPCRDGFVHLFVSSAGGTWDRFCAWLGDPLELADPALVDLNVRWRHADVVLRLTEAFTRARTKAELYTAAQAHHLPCVPVYSPAEFLEDPQTVARQIVATLPHPDLGTYRTLRPPLPIAAPLARPAPRVGEHNAALAHEWGAARATGARPSRWEGARDPESCQMPPERPPTASGREGAGGAQGAARALSAGRVTSGGPGRAGDRQGAGSAPDAAREHAPCQGQGQGPLSGVRVCAFTHVAAGPYATLQLAYLGAEVIKVESRTRLDSWRYRDRNPDPEQSRPFADHNKNVRSVLLNLKTPEGVDLARRLIATCDVVVDNYSVGVMDRLGLGFDALRAVREDVIVLHMAGLGATGPRRDHVTYGPSVMALCGMTYLWNLSDAPRPVGSQSSYPDYVVGVYAAYAVVAALHRRARSGTAQLLDLAQVEAMACAIGSAFVATLNGDAAAVQPLGNSSGMDAPQGCYPCAAGAEGYAADDAWCVIAVESDAQWEGLKRALGQPAWAEDPGLATAAGRLARAAALDAHLAEWTRERAPRGVMETCQTHGVPAGLVATGQDVAHDPHLAARCFLLEREHPRMGAIALPNAPVRLHRQPIQIWRLGPLLGEDTDYVLRDLVGLTGAEVERYAEQGVLR